MDIQKQLLNAGYKKYVSKSNEVFKATDTLYQKCIKDEIGNLYFIDAWYYPETHYSQVNHKIEEAVQFEVQYTDKNDVVVMNVALFEKDHCKAEEYFANIHNQLNLGYHEKY